MTALSKTDAAGVLLSIHDHPERCIYPPRLSIAPRRRSAWGIFVQDPHVKKHIMSKRRHPEKQVLQHFTEVARFLWERVKKDKVMFSQWQARADRINASRMCQAPTTKKKPRIVSTPGPNGTHIVDFYNHGSHTRPTSGPARIIYNEGGKILQVFVAKRNGIRKSRTIDV